MCKISKCFWDLEGFKKKKSVKQEVKNVLSNY